jgi:hypothetical protein
MSKPKQYTINELKGMKANELILILKGYGIDGSSFGKITLLSSIINEQNKQK